MSPPIHRLQLAFLPSSALSHTRLPTAIRPSTRTGTLTCRHAGPPSAPPSPPPRGPKPMTRRAMLRHTLLGALGLSLGGAASSPRAAHADMPAAEAEGILRDVRRLLDSELPLQTVSLDTLPELRRSLRSGSFSRFRVAIFNSTHGKGRLSSPEGLRVARAGIAAVEKLDNVALRAVRGQVDISAVGVALTELSGAMDTLLALLDN